MNVCPITYEPCAGRYSARGLGRLARGLTTLRDLPFTAAEQLAEAAARADKLSIQGNQPKLSARIAVRLESFVLVDAGGRFILKPPCPPYPELPENEDLTMRLAEAAGIEVPLHGLVYAKDGTRTYFVKRFDRLGRGRKLAVEDFAQLSGRTRQTKYDSSMEQVAQVVSSCCTFPALEHVKLLRLTLFCLLVGNEDMHLKNFSVIVRGNKVELAPAYDLLSSTVALRRAREELALPLGGKKTRITRGDVFVYFAKQRLGLTAKAIARVIGDVEGALPRWRRHLEVSFLSEPMKDRYRRLIESRTQRLLAR